MTLDVIPKGNSKFNNLQRELNHLTFAQAVTFVTFSLSHIELRGGILPLRTELFIECPFALCCMVNGESSE